jgi:hypothetical protein
MSAVLHLVGTGTLQGFAVMAERSPYNTLIVIYHASFSGSSQHRFPALPTNEDDHDDLDRDYGD